MNSGTTLRDTTISRHRSFLAWLVPDLPMTFALLTLISVFVAFGGATSLFEDGDTGWHIRIGEQMLRSGLLPRADPFSFSKPGQPWIAWEWGAEVLMASLFHVAGLGGIALMSGLTIAASAWMWFRLSEAAGGNCLIAALCFLPALTTTQLHWLARPHLLSWIFLLGAVWFCERPPQTLRWFHLAAVATGAATWANVHGSFFFGPLIAFIYAAGAYAKPLIWDLRPPSPHGEGRQSAANYLRVAFAASAGTLANPSGWRLHQHVVSYLTDSGMVDHIMEFQSFNFHSSGAIQVFLVITLSFAGAFASLAIAKPERFLLSLVLIGAALRAARALPMAALLLTPLASGSLTEVLIRTRSIKPGLRRAISALLEYGDGIAATGRRFHGFALLLLAAGVILVAIHPQAAFPPDEFPVAAGAAVALLPAGARILSPDLFGSYLIYRFHGQRKVFFDGRSDFYGIEFLAGYSRLEDLRPGWRKEFNRWNFTHALLPAGDRMVPALEASGWRELYRDRTAVLLTGNSQL